MKQVNLKLSAFNNFTYSFKLRNFNINNSLLDRFHALLRILFSVLGLFQLPILLFSIYFLNDSTYEESAFFVLGIYLIVEMALLILIFLFEGKAAFREPLGFMPVLFFAFFNTLSPFISNNSKFNSFGTDNVKGLSTLFTIFCLGLFYIVNLSILSKKQLKTYLYIFTFSVVLFGAYATLFTDANPDFLPMLLLIPIFLIYSIKSSYKFYFFTFVVLLISLYLSQVYSVKTDTWLKIFFVATITAGYILLLVVLKDYQLIKRTITNTKSKILALKTIFSFQDKNAATSFLLLVVHIFKIFIILSPFILGMITLVIYKDTVPRVNILSDMYEGIKESFNTIGHDGIKKLLFGIGSGNKNLTTNIFASNSMISNIIVSQGLVGIFSYVILFVFAIYFIIKNIGSSLTSQNKENIGIALIIGFNTLFIILLTLFIYPGILMLLMLWFFIGISISFNRLYIMNQKEETYGELIERGTAKNSPVSWLMSKNKYLHLVAIFCIVILEVLFLYFYISLKNTIN